MAQGSDPAFRQLVGPLAWMVARARRRHHPSTQLTGQRTPPSTRSRPRSLCASVTMVSATGDAGTQFVEVRGLRLWTSVRGAGPPLLLINGIGASLELLEPIR